MRDKLRLCGSCSVETAVVAAEAAGVSACPWTVRASPSRLERRALQRICDWRKHMCVVKPSRVVPSRV